LFGVHLRGLHESIDLDEERGIDETEIYDHAHQRQAHRPRRPSREERDGYHREIERTDFERKGAKAV